ncbi:ABC transporter ATP-binding protein [Salinarimonas soli]|uniref:ABC transporter ATP-binding protein n=1 Tax=Salinarimonas soli TaxID=1638099 RepID=A0A5B2VCP6_9HYPH|nr:ABC transporter ATP-binding protein [Salinarimonas soli]KAA2235917.1 ABC transporter ATP-binding protein [Salinarimonas soli]
MTGPLLQVTGLSKSYTSGGGLLRPGRRATVVDDVSFVIERGEAFGLVGESGSGKSTIGRLVLRLVEADAGSIVFDGIDVRATRSADLRRLRRRMQIVFQDPFSSLDPRVRIGESIAAPIRLHRLRSRDAVAGRVAELLALVGLSSEQASRYPHEFSGGQRQRIAIARALAVEPDLIVCDEPVSALDLSIQAQVVNLLADLRARLGVSYLFISHDMAVVRHLATRVGVLYAGRLVEVGPARRVFEDPRHPYTRMLLAASPVPVPHPGAARRIVLGEPPSPYEASQGCRFASRCPHAVPACLAAQPPLDAYGDEGRQAACIRAAELPTSEGARDDEALMSEAYRRRMTLLRDARGTRPA